MIETILGFFAEHGLTGLVIAMLFVVIFTFIKVLNKKDADHMILTKKMMDDCRDERKGMNDSFNASQDKLAKALDDLTTAIRHNK